MNKTFNIKFHCESQWYLINAQDKILGRLATQIASILMGKNKATYAPYINHQNHVIIINAQNIQITGNKNKQKVYITHSGRPGGLKIQNFEQLKNKRPNKILEIAVQNMLPKNKLGRQLFKNLKVYSDHMHPHIAQNPTCLNL